MNDDQKSTSNTGDMPKSLSLKYRVDEDGYWSAETDLGTLNIDKDGNFTAKLNFIKAICIGDLTSIKSHQIDDKLDTITHRIYFRNGGSCQLIYKKTGEVIDFRVGKIMIRVGHNDILTINPVD